MRFVVISQIENTFFVVDDGFINASFVPLENFREMVWEHDHAALECLFIPKELVNFFCRLIRTYLSQIWKEEIHFELEFDVDVLYKTVLCQFALRYRTASRRLNFDLKRSKKELVHSCTSDSSHKRLES